MPTKAAPCASRTHVRLRRVPPSIHPTKTMPMFCDLIVSRIEAAPQRDLDTIVPGTAVKVMLVVPNRVSHIAKQALLPGEKRKLPEVENLPLWFRVASKKRMPGPDGPNARWVGVYTAVALDVTSDDVWQESGLKTGEVVTFCDRNILEVGATLPLQPAGGQKS